MRGAHKHPSFPSRPVALETVIKTHVETVLSSSAFKGADSLRELLRFIVDETIAGRGDNLKEYVIAATVLRKGDSFDPKADPIVRVQMRRVRDRLERYYAAEGRHDSLIIDIPKGSYTATFRPALDGSVEVPAVIEEAVIVGRQQELTELRAAFESASARHGRLCCLSGEAGIGKTALVELFLRELGVSGARCYVARGRCSERLAGSEAYLPILEALETILRNGDEPLSELMSAVAPNWYLQIPGLSDAASADVSSTSRVASQERLKRELLTFLDEVSSRRPLVLFLDDLHWADASTVDMLAYWGGRCGSQRTLILGAYRPAELLGAGHPFLRMKLELQGHGICRETAMPLLTRGDVQDYLALQFPDHRFPPTLCDRIHDRTEGNPLFMTDLLRFLRDRGVLARREDGWVMVGELPAVADELPESIRSIVQKKLGELSETDRRLMSAAAVQGQEFDSAVIAKALQLDQAVAEERLEALDRLHGLVRLTEDIELPDGTLTLRYSFVHVLYQNALHDLLTATRKAALSMRVAQALVTCYQDRASEVASELALLFEAGRDFANASDFFLAAARNAARVYAAQEAIPLARRAIANAERLAGAERSRRVMAAALLSAEQHQSSTRWTEAFADFDLAERAAEESGDREGQIHIMYRRALVLMVAKRLPELREQGTRAILLAQATDSAGALASSQLIVGIENWCVGDTAAAGQQLDRAIPVLQQHDRFDDLLPAVLIRGGLHTFTLEHDEADRALGWGYERAGMIRWGFPSLFALFFRARVRANRGRLSEGREMLEEAMRLAELLEDRFWLPRVANTRGWLLSELGDTEAALRVNIEAAGLALEIGDAEAECMSRINAARDYLTLGESEQAWRELQQAEARCRQDTWFRWVYYPRLRAEMASYWMTRGDLQQARSCAQLSLEDAERTLSRKRMAWAHKLLGEIAMLEDRSEKAEREFEAALHVLDRHACPTIEWQILRAAASAAGTRGDGVARDELLGRARIIVHTLADSVHDDAQRRRFLNSHAVRDVVR